MGAIAEYIASLPDNESKLTQPFDEAVAHAALREPIRNYCADNDYDTRVKFSDLKIQARQFREKVMRFDKSIQDLSSPMKAALRMSLARSYGDAAPGEDRLAIAHEMSSSLIRICNALIEQRNKKTATRGVVSLAEPLWNYWETIMGKPFRRNWEECETRLCMVDRLGSESFVRTDALFVQFVIKAIDPTTEFSDIRTRLKSVAKKRAAAGKSRRAGAR